MRSCLLLGILIWICVFKCYAAPSTRGQVWPKPQQQKSFSNFMIVNPKSFTFQVIGKDCALIQEAIKRYRNIVANTDPGQKEFKFGEGQWESWNGTIHFSGFLSNLDVNVKETCSDNDLPFLDMNEGYNLNINSPRANYAILTANTVWGALRGLETFSQLLYIPTNNSKPGLKIHNVEIVDFPRFPHRGLLIDTSRHYLPLSTILKNLDAMAYNKFNVLHWHIVDDQSFPFQSTIFPELSNKGAYEQTLIYNKSAVKEVIEYARLRGIRVVAEFDTPGHTKSWGLGYQKLLTPCYSHGKLNGEFGPLDPSQNFTYQFVGKLFEEITETFPDQYIHLGGDEVDFTCWDSNPQIKQFMADHKMTHLPQIEEYYMRKAVDIIDGLKRKSLVWEEVFTNGARLPKDTVVHVWKEYNGNNVLNKATKSGYPVIESSCWYLDHLASNGDWHKFYQCDPYDFHPTPPQKKLIMGGEACMWGESVNVFNILPRIWPRASAVAEKLWSAQNCASITEAARRLEEHTCRMNVRKIPAQPPNGPGVCIPALKYGLYDK